MQVTRLSELHYVLYEAVGASSGGVPLKPNQTVRAGGWPCVTVSQWMGYK